LHRIIPRTRLRLQGGENIKQHRHGHHLAPPTLEYQTQRGLREELSPYSTGSEVGGGLVQRFP